VTEWADQLHHDNRLPILQLSCSLFFWGGKTSHYPGLSAPLQARFGSLQLLAFPKAKIAIEREVICECESHSTQAQSVASHCRLTSPTGEWLLCVRNYVTVLWVKRRPEAKIGTNTLVCFNDLPEQKCVHHKYVVDGTLDSVSTSDCIALLVVLTVEWQIENRSEGRNYGLIVALSLNLPGVNRKIHKLPWLG